MKLINILHMLNVKLASLTMKAMTRIVTWLDEFALFIITSAVAFISPIGHWIAIVGFLVVADTITALIAAKKNKKQIQSRKLFRTVTKFILYGIAVVIAEGLRILFMPDLPATKIMTAFIAVIELKSIDENYKVLTGKSFFKPLIDLLNKKDNDKTSKPDE